MNASLRMVERIAATHCFTTKAQKIDCNIVVSGSPGYELQAEASEAELSKAPA